MPLDKDAERAPLTKYKWWILGGLGLVMAVAAGFLLRAPASSPPAAPADLLAGIPAGGAMQALRDELFSLETDRLEGRLSDTQYAELKRAYDVVLRRALERRGEKVAAMAVVPES